MTIQESLKELSNLTEAEDIPVWYKTTIKKVMEAIEAESKTSIESLKALQEIKQIINNTIYIQEDVIRYKAICEVVKGVSE